MENAKARKRAQSDELASRLAGFAGEIIKRLPDLPATRVGRHIEDQLLRSATAPGAHYAEARGSQSPSDFIYKVALALKELREAIHGLETSSAGGYLQECGEVLQEGRELAAILTASLQTARRNRGDFKS